MYVGGPLVYWYSREHQGLSSPNGGLVYFGPVGVGGQHVSRGSTRVGRISELLSKDQGRSYHHHFIVGRTSYNFVDGGHQGHHYKDVSQGYCRVRSSKACTNRNFRFFREGASPLRHFGRARIFTSQGGYSQRTSGAEEHRRAALFRQIVRGYGYHNHPQSTTTFRSRFFRCLHRAVSSDYH